MISKSTVLDDTVILEVDDIDLYEIDRHLQNMGRGDYIYMGSKGNNLIYKQATKW